MVTIREADGRILVAIEGHSQWGKNYLHQLFRQTFKRHHEATWRVRDRCWSLPLGQRERLERWLESLPESTEVGRRC